MLQTYKITFAIIALGVMFIGHLACSSTDELQLDNVITAKQKEEAKAAAEASKAQAQQQAQTQAAAVAPEASVQPLPVPVSEVSTVPVPSVQPETPVVDAQPQSSPAASPAAAI